ncbi:MAG TPA: hypothetical protein VFE98_10945 [Candidatus Bathyarchaeia archaeon]|nr:hypothetical protein [Candidatus Bathyarchaeia archaeon]
MTVLGLHAVQRMEAIAWSTVRMIQGGEEDPTPRDHLQVSTPPRAEQEEEVVSHA